jgi:hypothetical protein
MAVHLTDLSLYTAMMFGHLKKEPTTANSGVLCKEIAGCFHKVTLTFKGFPNILLLLI